jgi:hypothetical protein
MSARRCARAEQPRKDRSFAMCAEATTIHWNAIVSHSTRGFTPVLKSRPHEFEVLEAIATSCRAGFGAVLAIARWTGGSSSSHYSLRFVRALS